LSDKEKGKLQKEILDTVFAEGIDSHWCARACFQTLADAKLVLADLAPLYEFLCQEIGWNPDASQLKRMQSANQTKLQELEAKIKDAEENLGDTEVKEALTAKADYLCRIGTDSCQTGTYGTIHLTVSIC